MIVFHFPEKDINRVVQHFQGNECGALCDLVPFVQYKKREKYPWRGVTFTEACNFTKINAPPWVFSRILNSRNDTKLRKVSQIYLKDAFSYFVKLQVLLDQVNLSLNDQVNVGIGR